MALSKRDDAGQENKNDRSQKKTGHYKTMAMEAVAGG